MSNKCKFVPVFRKGILRPFPMFLWTFVFCISAGVESKATSLSIASGATGGVYLVMGGGMAVMLPKHIPGVNVTAEVSAASVDNCELIKGRARIIFLLTE